MAKIDTSGWKEFVVGELFPNMVKPSVLHMRQVVEMDEGIRYVVRTKFNNGIKCRVQPVDNVEPSPAGVITWGAENASFFYQEEPFLSGRDIYYVDTRKYSANVCRFLATCLQTIVFKYPYNFGLFPELLKDERIMLPVDNNGEPNWTYMEVYMQKVLDEVEISIENLSQIKNRKERVDVKKWKRFHLYDNDLFNIDMGTKMDKAKMTELNPEVNFVGRANNNNGITTRVDKIMGVEPYEAGNMTLSLGGEYLDSCFIQPDVFYTSQNVVVLVPKWDMSFEVKQFISAMIFKESRLYYKAFVDELNRHIKTDFTFLLPVEADDKPDWKYMEQYMKDMIDVSKKVIENFELLNIC